MKTKAMLGKALKIFRIERELSQGEVGGFFGVSQQTIGDWERTGDIPTKRYDQVRDFYGIDPQEYDDDRATNVAKHHSNISGGNMEVTNHAQKDPLSVEEQFLINLLREKDRTKKDLLRYIQEQLAKEQ